MSKKPHQLKTPCPRTITAQSDDERRRRELALLLPLWPHEISDLSLKGRSRVVHFLARALREERRRARSGHWAYDLARHHQLARCWRDENAALTRLSAAEILRSSGQIKGPRIGEP